MKPILCPLCGGNMDEKGSDALLSAIEDAGGVASDTREPSGRNVVFGNGKSIRLDGWCNACDTDAILELLKQV